MAVQVVDMDGCIGKIDTFVVEPFVPHKQEYYLCIQVTPKLELSDACHPELPALMIAAKALETQ